ncbi:FecR family protein [Elizabethkingia meningoseptica]|uniref:FecR family protein n=1 Tax=Elizabethkingia meningoseptica TaxID=238 RepID=UPI0038922C2B
MKFTTEKITAFFFRLLDKEGKLLPKENQLLQNLLNKESVIQADEAEEKELIWKQLSEKMQLSINTKNAKQRAIRSYAVAASVVFVFALGFLFFKLNKDSASGTAIFTTAKNEIRKVTLPDGSEIFINNATTITYDKATFNKSFREVWLKEGEAFFSVTKNPEKPFIVHYQNLKTTVLGTSFNIKSYKALGESIVTVRTGKVQISDDKQVFGVFVKNERLTYDQHNNTSRVNEADAERTASWRSGGLVFSNAGFQEIAMRVNMKYGVKLVSNINLDSIRLNASFRDDESLQNVLDAICGIYQLQYKQQGKQIIFSHKTESEINDSENKKNKSVK